MESNQQQLGKVSIGIGMMLASVVVLFLYIISFFALPLTANIGSPSLTKVVLMIQVRFVVPIMITSTLLGVAGPCLCLTAPREVKGTGYVLISIGLNALALLISAVGTLVALPAWLGGIAAFLPYISIPFFILFVRRLAIYLEKEEIRKLAGSTLTLAGIAAVLGAVPWALAKFNINLGGNALLLGLVLPVLILVFAVLAFLRYLRMLEYARRATVGK